MDKKEQNRRCETGEWRTFSKCAEKRLTRQEDSFTPHVFVIIIIIIIQISAEITPNIFTSFWGVAEQIFLYQYIGKDINKYWMCPSHYTFIIKALRHVVASQTPSPT